MRAAKPRAAAGVHRAVFSRLADFCVLCPSRNPIAADHKERRLVRIDGRQVELWIERTAAGVHQGNGHAAAAGSNGVENGQHAEPQVFVLRFNGAGGRAEQTTAHPLDVWTDVPGEVWSPNPPGFGGSEGKPSLKWLAPTARGVVETLKREAGERPVVITGNSLGTTVALHVAAHCAKEVNLRGVILYNPPPLKELIRQKFGWRSLGLSHFVAAQIPPELDSVANASQAKVPCVFLRCERDRVVPPRFQRLISDAYGGPTRIVSLPNSDHVFTFAPAETEEYHRAVGWLRQRMVVESDATVASRE